MLSDMTEVTNQQEEEHTCNVFVTARPLEQQYAELTTCHGLNLIARSPSHCSKLIWTSVVACALITLSIGVLGLINDYWKYPTYMAVKTKYVNSLEFPAVTICGFNRFNNAAIVDLADNLVVDETNLWQYFSVGLGRAVHGSPEEQTMLHQSLLDIESTIQANFPGRRFEDLLSQVLFHIEDMISFNNSELCSWDDAERQIPCQREWFKEVVTMDGNCVTFNYAYNFSQVFTGSNAGLRVAINIHNHLNSERPGTIVPAEKAVGLKVLVQPPDHVPAPHENILAVSPGKTAFIDINLSNYTFLTPPYGECGSSNLRYFERHPYSKQSCMMECAVDFVLEECGCIASIMSSFLGTVGIIPTFGCLGRQLYTSNGQGLECLNQCPDDCRVNDHSLGVSYVDFPNARFNAYYERIFGLSSKYIRENVIIVNIYYGKLMYNEGIQTENTTPWGFISSIGGQMGLAIGASMVTVCEFTMYLVVRLYMSVVNRRSSNKSVSADNHDIFPEKMNNEASVPSMYV